ncbi:acyltransferase [Rubellimicrobium rubrum]|uniref:Acyltransferase n=1 Tax=Rubellimicrobium rubrum TaxID=2585369 RepID=A0A5C4MZ08_9RHOB|nr:lysophospholipid acyltransferase family protein [Rubellimicrobium rubrum]TNC49360.1 acyltransferase [Rubellimicrobium rubrum]
MSQPGRGVAYEREAAQVYDRRSLTYSNTFPDPWKRHAIRAVEWITAKPEILRRVRVFERRGAPKGQAFWSAALEVMGVELLTPPEQVARIPRSGPVVLVANHPHGLVDGMVLAELVGRVRPDYRILTRAILTGIDPSASGFMIPVPFPHEPNAQARMMAMRAQAMAQLASGGLLALFPSGVVASARTPFGPPVEAEWNLFTAKLIRLSGATVLPVRFPGANSRAYQIAACLSPTLRQGLLLREIVHAMDRPQAPVVGEPIRPEEMEPRWNDPRAFMAWLRERTLAL